jgi:hypothetical protein
MRVRAVGISLLLALGVGAAGAQSAIDRAAWLAGCWEARAPNRVIVEMWMPPMGGLMVGASRTVVGAAAREFEHLRLRARGDTLVYTALPSGQAETDFRATRASADSLVFENQAHDFPQRIIYRRRGADSVVARVEGPGPNQTTRGFNVAMRRVDCTHLAPGPVIPPTPPTP